MLKNSEENEDFLMSKISVLGGLNQREDIVDTYHVLSKLAPNNHHYPLQAAHLFDELVRHQEAVEYYGKTISLIEIVSLKFSDTKS